MSKLPLTEELDFAYLLQLMPPLHDVPQFSWLAELFAVIGHERLIQLCKFAGGETIRIPTIEELSDSIEALQWFYDVYIKKSQKVGAIPLQYSVLVRKICEVYDARNRES